MYLVESAGPLTNLVPNGTYAAMVMLVAGVLVYVIGLKIMKQVIANTSANWMIGVIGIDTALQLCHNTPSNKGVTNDQETYKSN
jgi:hypothetical protein